MPDGHRPQQLAQTLSSQLFTGVRLVIPGVNSWDVDTLTVNNCSVELGNAGFDLNVGGDLILNNGGIAMGSLVCGGDVTLTNGSKLHVYSSATNGVTDYGARMSVTGDVTVGPSCWIYPYSDAANGGSLLMRMDDLTVAPDEQGLLYTFSLPPGAYATTVLREFMRPPKA